MRLLNNSPNEVFFNISSPGLADCGTIGAGDTNVLSDFNNQENVQVTFTATPSFQYPFVIVIPETGTGMTVTIGIYQE